MPRVPALSNAGYQLTFRWPAGIALPPRQPKFIQTSRQKVNRISARHAMSTQPSSANANPSPPTNRRSRRLVIASPDGIAMEYFDLTGTRNANSSAPLKAYIEAECDMGHWHTYYPDWVLPLWSD